MNTNHIIEDNAAIDNWMAYTTVRYAARHGSGFNKTLEVNLLEEWIVTDHKVEVYRGERSKAIQAYNNITQRD